MKQVFSDNVVVSDQLNAIDLFIIIFFVGLFLILPKVLAKKPADGNSDQDYLLMSRGLTLPLFVATLTSTWYGGILGVTQIAFEQGVYSFFTQGLFWYFSYFAFAVFLAKKIRQKKVLSLPELIGQKFGERARRLAAVILFFHAMPVTYAISVGLLLQMALGMDFFWGVVAGVMIVAIYTSFGGFRGVVVTDCLQFVLMFVAVIMVVSVSIYKFGGLSFLAAELPPKYFAWRGEHTISSALIWLFIACTSTFIHPVFYQRCLAAKSNRVAILGIFIAMIFWLVFDLSTTLGGMYARALFPTTDSAKAYLQLGIELLPHGLRGIFVSGVLATILSTLDSFMFVAGTTVSYDLIGAKSIFRSYGHPIAIFFCAAVVIVLASMFGANFEATWLFMEGAFSTSMMVPAMAAVLLKRRFRSSNFLMPASGALVTFGLSTYLYRQNLIAIEPFYLAHGAALGLFILILHRHAQSDTKMAQFANG